MISDTLKIYLMSWCFELEWNKHRWQVPSSKIYSKYHPNTKSITRPESVSQGPLTLPWYAERGTT
jgi:hypothetical protein